MRFWRLVLILALCLGLAAALPALAEQGSSGSDMGGSSSQGDAGGGGGGAAAPEQQQDPAAGGQAGPQAAAPAAEMKEIEGTISGLNAQQKSLKIGGFAGLFGTDLQVTDQTRFVSAAGAAPADFSSLKEGDRVRASYQKVGDKNVANEIMILSAPGQAPGAAGEEKGGAAAPSAPEGGAAGAGGGGQAAPGAAPGGAGGGEQSPQPAQPGASQ
jgi:hypothetical protein